MGKYLGKGTRMEEERMGFGAWITVDRDDQ